MRHESTFRRFSRRGWVLVLTLLVGSPLLANDWPQWRGPQRDGKSGESGLLQSWPAGGPPLAYKSTGIGTGFSTVAVAGGRVYTLGDIASRQYLVVLAAADGQLIYKVDIGPAWNDEFLGPRSTPAVDGDRVYALSTEGDLVCLATTDGKLLWKRNLPQDFGGTLMKAKGSYHWKFAESPLVDGDFVLVTPGSQEAALVALDKKTGKEVWRTAIPELGPAGADGTGYSSVVISEGAGVRQYVQLLGRGLIGVDAKTGRLLWSYNRVANDIANIPTPLIDGDYVFASTGYGTGAALLKLEKKEGGGVAAKEIYFLAANTFQNHHGGMILHQGHVYAGTGHNKGLPIALELASGKVVWGPERNEGNGSAAIAYGDGRIYLRYQNGKVILVAASPKGYAEHGSFDIPDVKHPSWPHPVISGGRLYLREQDTLYVYDIKARAH